MKILRFLFCATAGVALATAASAYPNFNATTGIIAVPTAFTVGSGAFIGAADVLFADDLTLNARAIYGVTDRLELGASLTAGTDTAFGVTGST